MDMSMGSRFKRAWNTFFNRDPTHSYNDTGPGYFYRPDRTRFSRGNERSIVTSVYNRISLDGAAISIQHVRLDENERYISNVSSKLNNCLTLEANLDQTARAFRQDVIMSMLDEGCIWLVTAVRLLAMTRSMKPTSVRSGLTRICIQSRLSSRRRLMPIQMRKSSSAPSSRPARTTKALVIRFCSRLRTC